MRTGFQVAFPQSAQSHRENHEETRQKPYQTLDQEFADNPHLADISRLFPDYSHPKQVLFQAMIQRCLVHAQRVVRRYATSTPRTTAGVTIYALAKQFTRIHTPDQATTWILNLHEFGQIYQEFLNEKTLLPLNRRATTKTWEYTHPRVRKTYHSLLHLARKTGFLPTSLHLLPLSILTGEKLRPTP